ncbi:MAG: acyl-CoA dehydrogenase family protein [Rhodospirillaceae bacterium]
MPDTVERSDGAVVPPDELVARARALVPAIREAQERTERDRQVSTEIFDRILDADLYRVMQPKRWGGFEHGFGTFVDVAFEIARGCGSTGWVYAITSKYQWLLGMFPPEAQEDVWGKDRNGRTCASFTPTGTATPVDGGYRLKGSWGFCSGLDNCPWVLVAVNVPDASGSEIRERGYVIVPKAELTIDDDWKVVGLTGTGSKTVLTDDLFVPGHRYLSIADSLSGNPPGAAVNPGDIFRVPAFAALSISVCVPTIGMAQGAYDEFVGATRERVTRGAALSQPVPMAELPTIQLRIGDAAACIDAAKMIVRRDAQGIMDTVAAGGELSVGQRARNKGNLGFAAGLALRAVDELFEAGGGKGLYLESRLQRYWRDAHAGAMHISVNRDAVLALYGRVELGLPPGPAQF